MAREALDKWFYGEKLDPVFEGVVRDFCAFDDTMHTIHGKVGNFMRGVDQLVHGLVALSDGVSVGLAHVEDSQIASDSCKFKEATNQIARSDAPHSSIAKLRRDLHFNVLNPMQNHIANNRNLKVSLDIRRRRLGELNAAKRYYEDCKTRLNSTDKKMIQAQSSFEAAKNTFTEVDRHVFEWLYILEEYRGDILDSTLQTLKYLQYEFFASSAHAISGSLPQRMEFRPMVEMTPEHLEVQVEMELQESNLDDEAIADFSARLIDKKVRDNSNADELPTVHVDPLSLSSLLSQGFEEGPARRALRLHQNDTQAALDWLIDGGVAEAPTPAKSTTVVESVRMPTTMKRMQRLTALRKRQQQERLERERSNGDKDEARNSWARDKEKDRDRGRDGDMNMDGDSDCDSHRDTDRTPNRNQNSSRMRSSDSEDENSEDEDERVTRRSKTSAVSSRFVPHVEQLTGNLLDMDQGSSGCQQEWGTAHSGIDLLHFCEEAPPTDFSKSVDFVPLPANLTFDTALCEKPPLPASLAAGIAPVRGDVTGETGHVQRSQMLQAESKDVDLMQTSQRAFEAQAKHAVSAFPPDVTGSGSGDTDPRSPLDQFSDLMGFTRT